MKNKIIILKYDVYCDLCGHRINKGEKCRLAYDKRHNYVFFEHVICPHGIPCKLNHKPIAPSNRVLVIA